MKLARMYAEALEQSRASNKTPSQLLHGLRDALRRRGHERLLPHIFAEYQKIIAARGATGSTVRVANERDRADAMRTLEALTGQTESTVCTDPSLVSGFVVSGKDFRHDASGRRALIDLYKTLITTP